MLTDRVLGGAFEVFVKEIEPRLRDALSACLGSDRGRDATAEALAYAWEHWERVRAMDNPAGYLYVLGRDRGRKASRSRMVHLLPIEHGRMPWIEPELPQALARLTERQRIVVMLIYCFDWTLAEVARLLGLSKSTVQSYAERGLSKLRRELGVE